MMYLRQGAFQYQEVRRILLPQLQRPHRKDLAQLLRAPMDLNLKNHEKQNNITGLRRDTDLEDLW